MGAVDCSDVPILVLLLCVCRWGGIWSHRRIPTKEAGRIGLLVLPWH